MTKCTLSAYILPGESAIDQNAFVLRINQFISERRWACEDVWAVAQERSGEDGEIGLNLLLPEHQQEPPGWFQDIEAIVAFCVQARRELKRDFAIGLAGANGLSEDLIEIDSERPDVEYIKRFIGV
jgi:hypothetical protein